MGPRRSSPRAHQTVRDALILTGNNLGHRVVQGASYSLIGTVLRTIVTLGSVSFLARLLAPADFGYIAMATIVTELAALFGNFGFASVLIQKRVITRLQIDTVFWASAVLGAMLYVSVVCLSYLAAAVFHEPMVGPLLRWLGLAFVIESLVVVHGALIIRLMRFHTDFWIQSLSTVARAITAIVFAWLGYGVWSLVIGSLTGAALRSLLSVIAISYWPRLKFHHRYLQSTWKTNSSYFAGGFLFYANTNIDLLFIGHTLGATALGYYQNARALSDEVRYRIASPLQRVLFPAFSALQHNTGSLQASVVRSGRLLAAIVIPIGIGIAAVADELVPILYGQQWMAMIPILKLLGVSTAIRASTMIATPLFNAMDRVGLGLRYSIVGSLITLALVLMAGRHGIVAVSAAIAVSALYSVFSFRIALGLIGLDWSAAWRILAPSTFAATAMWIGIETVRALYGATMSDLPATLMLHVLLGAVIYATLLGLVSPASRLDFRSAAAKLRPKPTGG